MESPYSTFNRNQKRYEVMNLLFACQPTVAFHVSGSYLTKQGSIIPFPSRQHLLIPWSQMNTWKRPKPLRTSETASLRYWGTYWWQSPSSAWLATIEVSHTSPCAQTGPKQRPYRSYRAPSQCQDRDSSSTRLCIPSLLHPPTTTSLPQSHFTPCPHVLAPKNSTLCNILS